MGRIRDSKKRSTEFDTCFDLKQKSLLNMLNKIKDKLEALHNEWDDDAADASYEFEQKNYTSRSVKGRELETKEEVLIRCSAQLENVIDYIERQQKK